MLFRILTLTASVLLALGMITQVVFPALFSRRLFPLFRKESRLERAERLRVEALERRKAAEQEAEALRVEIDAEKVDSEMLRELTQPDKSKKGPRLW